MAMSPPTESEEAIDHAAVARAPDSALEAAVKASIDLHGPSLLFEPGRLAEILNAQSPEAGHEVALLIQALEEQVPEDLLGAHSNEEVDALLPLLAKRLADRKDLSPEASNWAVTTWARVLGISSAATQALAAPLLLAVNVSSTADEQVDAAVPGGPLDSEPRAGSGEPHIEAAFEGRRSIVTDRRLAGALILVAIFAAAIAIWFGFFYRSIEITRVTSNEPLIGDGKKREVFVAFHARRFEVRRVDVDFIRGDAPWDDKPIRIDVAPEAAVRGLIPAGRLGMRTTKPSKATFRYVLVGVDGSRSAPFEKTFEIAPAPAQPPVITAAVVPRGLVVGKPFSLTIAYDPGESSLSQLELRFVDSTVKWPSDSIVVAVSELASTKAGSVTYPFAAINTPSRSTLDVTLVDLDGVRSAPRRVVLDVAKPPPTHVASPACTNTTCGRVLAVREIDQPPEGISGFIGRIFGQESDRGRKLYEVTVRLDNGTTRILRETTRWNSGARVRMVGSTVSLRCLEPRDGCW